MNHIFEILKRKLLHLRLSPIRVFCFHQVSDVFEPDTMMKCDWTQIDLFKRRVMELKRSYTFISLTDATEHLKHDCFRVKKYAVLTADDGWASLKNVIPWLAEQDVPVTLFINPAYLDGIHYRKKETERYLSKKDLTLILDNYNNVSIASHGWNHCDITLLSEMEICNSVGKSLNNLQEYSKFVRFYAYAWGKHNDKCDKILSDYSLIPVLMDGMKNYKGTHYIHRELLMSGTKNEF